MSGHIISLNKQPGVRPFGIGEMWCRLFAKCVLKVTGFELTHACTDGQLCAGSKAEIDRAVHRVQSIWEANSTKNN